jgi:hypothetical protein
MSVKVDESGKGDRVRAVDDHILWPIRRSNNANNATIPDNDITFHQSIGVRLKRLVRNSTGAKTAKWRAAAC